jgi:hypothetical protein
MDFPDFLFRNSGKNMTAGFKTWLTGMIFPIGLGEMSHCRLKFIVSHPPQGVID